MDNDDNGSLEHFPETYSERGKVVWVDTNQESLNYEILNHELG